MSKINTTKPVGEIAAEIQTAIPLFEDMKIDYCCAGDRTLQEACALAGVPVDKMVSSLEKLQTDLSSRPKAVPDWRKKSMSEIIDIIVEKHHVYTRAQLGRIKTLSAKVIQTHGTHHPELFNLDNLIHDMSEEMEGHMAKEEEIVFSYLKEVERSRERGLAIRNPFTHMPYDDKHPLSILIWEHGMTGDEWMEIHRITRNFMTPPEACASFKALYRALKELEEDIHRHVHLENNILFKRAIEMKVLD